MHKPALLLTLTLSSIAAADGPAKELTDYAKQLAGSWKCTATAELGGKMIDGVTGSATHKLDLDNYWVATTLTLTVPKAGTMHGLAYTTYDPDAKKLYRVSINGHGGHAISWGTPNGSKVSWEGEAHVGSADVKTRGSDDFVSAKEVHIAGEYSKDGGKSWIKDHEAICKK